MAVKLTPSEAALLRCFAACSMKPYTTARTLPSSTSYVWYNLRKIMTKTGLNPNNFFDLCALLGYRKEDEYDLLSEENAFDFNAEGASRKL